MVMLEAKIEALLFVASKPITIRKLAECLNESTEDIVVALQALAVKFNKEESGLRLVKTGHAIQLASSPDFSKTVRDFLKEEVTGELTRPQLETLTVIAYCQPITKPELEQIRGVNCSLILRNLMIRGLVESEESKEKFGSIYRVTHDFMRFLGITDVRELPDYEKLSSDEYLQQVINNTKLAA